MPRVGIVLIDTPGVPDGCNPLALEITPGIGKSVFSKVRRGLSMRPSTARPQHDVSHSDDGRGRRTWDVDLGDYRFRQDGCDLGSSQ